MIIKIKSTIFYIVYIFFTIIYFFIFLFSIPLPRKVGNYVGISWCFVNWFLVKHIIGLDFKVEGKENIPSKPSIICSKHQSTYETLALQLILPPQVFVVKKELLKIPIVSTGLKVSGAIPIDRNGKSNAIQQIIEIGKQRKKEGFFINIFPEGTRVRPGERKRFKLGAGKVAKALEMDVLPIALNSGVFWPIKSFLRYPGTITFIICKPIPHDFGTAEQIMKECEKRIQEKQDIIDKVKIKY